MDEVKTANGTPTQGIDPEALKQKYGGKVYKVGVTVPIDDESEQEFSYFFKRPSVPSYDRYIKTASKVGITKASKAFMQDAVVAITIGNKLTELLGLTDGVNLKKL